MQYWGKTEYLFRDLKTILDAAEEEYDVAKMNTLITRPDSVSFINKNEQAYPRQASDSTKDIIYLTEKPIFDRFGYSTEVYN